jgi:type III restriction enzyme
VSRNSIKLILQESDHTNQLRTNPEQFLAFVLQAIEQAKVELMVDGIKYEKLNGQFYEMRLFKDEEVERCLSNLHEVGSGSAGVDWQSAQDKTLYDHVAFDSKVELEFAKACETDNRVRFFFKLPRKFTIPTPLGEYNPDWAVIFENDQRIYFVAETKGSSVIDELRSRERLKVQCAKAHFSELGAVQYRVVRTFSDLAV